MEDLKPCPLCGGKVVLRRHKTFGCSYDSIQCDACHLALHGGGTVEWQPDYLREQKKFLIVKWNNRV